MPRADNLSRALLVLILLCLVVLCLRGDGASDAASEAPEPVAARTDAARYDVRTVNLLRKPPLILRTDTATGAVWRMSLLGPGKWEALREGLGDAPSAGADEPGRYSVQAVGQRRGAPTLVRSDHHTGRIWRKGSTNDGAWVAVPNPGEEPSTFAPVAEADAPEDTAAPETTAPTGEVVDGAE